MTWAVNHTPWLCDTGQPGPNPSHSYYDWLRAGHVTPGRTNHYPLTLIQEMGTFCLTAPGSHLAYHGEVPLVRSDVWPRQARLRNAGSERQSPHNALESQG